jgi:hypothetical protein
MMNNEEIINKWLSPLYKGRGYILLDDINLDERDKLNKYILDLVFVRIPNGNMIYISNSDNNNLEVSNNIQCINLNKHIFRPTNNMKCDILIIDTFKLTYNEIATIANSIKFKYVMVYAYNDELVRYKLKMPILNHVPYTEDIDIVSVELEGIEKEQYDAYSDFISTKMAVFAIPEIELKAIPEIINTFVLIQACAVGTKLQNANYYRLYIAQILGWSSDLDLSIPYMKEINDNFSPYQIGEIANIIMSTIKSRNDILKNSISKRKAIKQIINNNIGNSIVAILPSTNMLEDIGTKLEYENIKFGLYSNNLKSRTLNKPNSNLPQTYKTGVKTGTPKLFGATVLNEIALDNYNEFKHNILLTSGILNDKFKPNRVDVLIIANLNVDYNNVFKNKNFIFPSNKNIKIIYVHINEQKEVNKLKTFMFNNKIKYVQQKRIIKQIINKNN